MPAVSRAQYNMMQMAAHNPEKAAEMGMKPETAREYVKGQSPKGLPAHVKSAAKKLAKKGK
jgi:hypothetical protein